METPLELKNLTRAGFEEEGADRILIRREISRRNPVKTMFMGVVFQAQPEHEFDGKFSVKQISRIRQLE
jgi:hypothetical protein